MCGHSPPPSPQSNSPALFECQLGAPTIQFSSDAMIPQVKGSVSRACPPLQTPIASPGCHLCFWQTGYKLEVPTTLSFVSIICLNGPPNSKNSLLPGLLVYYKKDTKEQPDARCLGQSRGKRYRMSICLCRCVPSRHLHVFTNPEALQTPSVKRGFKRRLHYTDTGGLNHWTSVIKSTSSLSPFPEVGGWGSKLQLFNHQAGSPPTSPSTSGASQKSPH